MVYFNILFKLKAYELYTLYSKLISRYEYVDQKINKIMITINAKSIQNES